MKSASPLARLLSYTSRYRSQYWLASIYSVLNKLFDIAPEILIGVAVDVVVQKQNSLLGRWGIVDSVAQLKVLAWITFAIWFFESMFEYLYSVGWRNLAQSIQHDLRIDTYQHVQSLDVAYFENQSSGNLVSIMNDDINQLERFLDGGANALIQVATSVLAVGGVFFYLSPTVAFWSMLPMPAIILGAYYYENKARPLYVGVREKAGALASRLTNNLTGLVTIKAQTAEQLELEHIRQQSMDYMRSNADAIKISSAFIPVIRMAILAGFLATLVVGGLQTLDGRISVGVYGVLVFLTQRLLWPLTSLAQTIDLYQRAMASTRRVLDLLQTNRVAPSGSQVLERGKLKGHISFNHISFSYESRERTLDDVSFEIESGTTVALVGATGSGKSTIAKLLLRFYEPKSGSIKIDQHPLADINPMSLRQNIGFVGQDHFLIDGSISENIAYGYPDASKESIERAARLAEVWEFAQQLPEGLGTIVGERGQKLSGGQRQRIAIARAILKDPPILVLDEATSAVDNETERLIQRSIRSLSTGRTLLIIAHRLSTIRHAKTIHVMESGKIVESGTHESLLAKGAIYAKLWNIQSGAELD